ncbi:MAG TPA: TerC family protein [Bryobacteraceae bacterium]|nr:TerC family protein [Bryobacteraceae bacterium]
MPTLSPTFFFDALSIILIDVLLGGDNAVVIALAVKSLPGRQRKMGILIGTAAAVVLRIILTFFAAQLLTISFLKLGGGLVILWIAVKLLADASEQEAGHHHVQSLRHAVWLILVADVTMSVDNILAVAGASKGNLPLLIFGLALSITFVACASGILANLMDRYPIIIWAGSAILGRVGGDMIITDPKVIEWLRPGHVLEYGFQAICAVGVLAIAWLVERRAEAQTVARD